MGFRNAPGGFSRKRAHSAGRSRYWFVSKRFGWGWTPSSREGWIVTVAAIGLYIPLFLQAVRSLDAGSMIASALWLAAAVAVLTALLVICYRTGEKPHWRWG